MFEEDLIEQARTYNKMKHFREERAKALFVKLFNLSIMNDEEYHLMRVLLLQNFANDDRSMDAQIRLLETVINKLQQVQANRKHLETLNKDLKDKILYTSQQRSPVSSPTTPFNARGSFNGDHLMKNSDTLALSPLSRRYSTPPKTFRQTTGLSKVHSDLDYDMIQTVRNHVL
jgi:hypothetical protein